MAPNIFGKLFQRKLDCQKNLLRSCHYQLICENDSILKWPVPVVIPQRLLPNVKDLGGGWSVTIVPPLNSGCALSWGDDHRIPRIPCVVRFRRHHCIHRLRITRLFPYLGRLRDQNLLPRDKYSIFLGAFLPVTGGWRAVWMRSTRLPAPCARPSCERREACLEQIKYPVLQWRKRSSLRSRDFCVGNDSYP